MPFYEYRCDNGHTFEVMQRMTDDPVTTCETCESPVQRVFHPVAVHFKGSGFYTTDYGRGRAGGSSDDSGPSESTAKKPEDKKKPEKSESGSKKSDSSSSSSSSSSD